MSTTASLSKHLNGLKDPRLNRKKRHELVDILVISICGVMCGAEGWTDIAAFGSAKVEWLRTFLKLPNGIPSHDTFGRVFSLLDGGQVQACFAAWVSDLARLYPGEVVALDGKTVRRSGDKLTGKAAIEMVSAWAHDAGLVLGQRQVEDLTNEIATVPELLKILALRGCIVTVDAANCQTQNARIIIEQGGDYVFALKGNQGTLHQEVQALFKTQGTPEFKDVKHSTVQHVGKRNGHAETRRFTLVHDTDYMEYFNRKERWWHLAGVGRVERQWWDGTQRKEDSRYFITSLSDITLFAKAARGHWRIENDLHWQLDIAFREDDCRIREGHSGANFVVLRHIALNLLKQDASVKLGIKSKRKLAGWSHDYLLKLLAGLF